MDHSALDRHVGAALLRAILGRPNISFDVGRLRIAAEVLAEDLRRQFTSDGAVDVVTGPFLDDAAVHYGLKVTDETGADHLLIVRPPIVNLSYDAANAIEGPWQTVTPISELTIRKNLPEATRQALDALIGAQA
jgi:hypothetical protein